MALRREKRGRTFLDIYRVNMMEMGTVTAKTSTSGGLIRSIMTSEPTTVMTLEQIWTRSLEREVLTVSIS